MNDRWSVLEWTTDKKTKQRGLRRYGPWAEAVAMSKRDQLNQAGATVVAVVRDMSRG